jgi:hypothetical protein
MGGSASWPWRPHALPAWVETGRLAWASSTDTIPVGTAMML